MPSRRFRLKFSSGRPSRCWPIPPPIQPQSSAWLSQFPIRNSQFPIPNYLSLPLVILAVFVLLSSGCSGGPPLAGDSPLNNLPATYTPASSRQPQSTQEVGQATDQASKPTHTPEPDPSENEAAIAILPADDSSETELEAPLPPGSGLRPDQAVFFRPPESGPDSPVDWRPPPVPVPHSLHPDDHYWLVRPIPSDRRNYELEWYPYGNRPTRPEALPYRVHRGMDFPNEPGTSVFAASSGTVIWASPLPSNRDGINYYGNTVVIHHDWQWQGQDVYTLYAHTLELFVEVGDYVEQGQLIAGVGATGHVSGPHLHLEVRVGENNYSSTRNGALWLAPYEGWGTLAGRFMDSRGRVIHGAMITVIPLDVESSVEVPTHRQRTYSPFGPNSDEIWQENFVFGDLPAGEYRVVLTTSGEIFRRNVNIKPGQTNFIVVQADFKWSPTVTPTPTFTPTPIPPPTAIPTPGS